MASGGEDPSVDADETDKGMLDEKIAVNFASKEQLMSVTGIGEKIASAILSVQESSGNITKPVLNLLTKNTLPAESWSQLDFQLNTSLDPGMIIDESVKFKHPSTLSGIETTSHPPGPTSSVKDANFSGAILDTNKKHLTPTKHTQVKSELVTPTPTPPMLTYQMQIGRRFRRWLSWLKHLYPQGVGAQSHPGLVLRCAMKLLRVCRQYRTVPQGYCCQMAVRPLVNLEHI